MAVKTTRRRRQPALFDIQASEPEGSSDESDKENDSGEEREDATRDDTGRHPTPVRMQAPSDHDRESIHPYVREDLKGAKAVGFFSWTEAVLGMSSTKLLARAREIAKLRWFEDKIIQDALIDYCRGTTEKARYNPFVHLSNRIAELARGKLTGVSKYPVNDFCIANNSDRVVQTIPEHGALGAKRRPDLLGLSQSTAVKLYSPRGSVHWFDILFWGELKQINVLVEPLSKERKGRYMSSLDDSGFPSDRPKVILHVERRPDGPACLLTSRRNLQLAGPRPRRSPVEPDVQTDHEPAKVRVGRKRLAEDDLLAGLDLGSSSKRRNPWGDTNDLCVGGEAAIQSGSYALELLSCTYGTRAHCFSFVLKDDKMTLWFYDASGVVYTKECISLVSDFEVFAAVIVAFACCTPEQFGSMPLSIMKSTGPARHIPPENLTKYKLTMTHPLQNKKVTVTLDKSLFTQYTLTGRRSFLYTIKTTPTVSSKDMIVKFSYQVCTRKAEQDLVAIARKAGVKHLPRIHMWGELWKLSDGIRKVFYRKSKGTAKYEDRTLRAIVYTQYASIKDLFSRSCELIPVMVDQMIDCLHDLRFKARMLHRDISISNVMYQIREGQYYFVLIDFDMAIALPAEGESTYAASSNHRTGTLPFMAYELVYNASLSDQDDWAPIPHLLRHDYESLFWLSLWCILTLLSQGLSQKQVKKHVRVAKALERGELEQIAGYKAILSMSPLLGSGIVLPPTAEPLAGWFTAWNIILIQSVATVQMWKVRYGPDRNKTVGPVDDSEDDQRKADKEEWETASGLYTRDRLKAALSRAYPIHAESADVVELEESDSETENPGDIQHDESPVEASNPKEPKPQRVIRTRSTTRRQAAQAAPPPENDIRSRLRPRPPRRA
ncbi:hypothetical protein NM688_g7634 [Phlebia brevispora]|uniref:Uncharacterized protein n=1 Tax=Phlebia brevispora TaxID=194682 RepID=A0ACC1S331_9APHY|nr:hypothetical protein NM688_g7634 [Phlebia brevispora]